MRVSTLLVAVLVTLVSSSAFAASYQRTDGTVVDPILVRRSGSVHPYSGVNLGPLVVSVGADLSFAHLEAADLYGANLAGANLTNVQFWTADLREADLSSVTLFDVDLDYANLDGAALTGSDLRDGDLFQASLVGADLSSSDLTGARVDGADLSGAILNAASGLSASGGSALYNINTDFTGTGFDPVAAGWTLVPEPSTAVLLGLGLTALAVRRGD